MHRRLRRNLFLHTLETRSVPNATAHMLANSNFSQDWTDTALIGVSDNWDNVPSIIGYRGDGLVGVTNADPQTVLADGTTTPVDVNANLATPNTFATGGIAEFELANPAVGLHGSGTARAPFLLIHLDTTGVSNVNVQYLLRDLEDGGDNANSKVALQYRVGNFGDFINVPSAYVLDASQGPNVAGPDTPVNITLPVAADNQLLVQVRIMTCDSAGSDEWIGIDNIAISGTGGGNNVAPSNQVPGPQSTEQDKSLTLSAANNNALSVSDPDAGTGELKINLKTTDGTLTLGTTTGLTFSLGDGTTDSEMTFTGTLSNINAALDNTVYAPSLAFIGAATITINSDDQGNTGPGGAKTDTDNVVVNVIPPLYHVLANGPLTQNWTNAGLITTDNAWSNVPHIRGYRGDGLVAPGGDPQAMLFDGSATPLSVTANQANPDTLTVGGIAEFDGIANPVVALQGSATADLPHLVLFLDTTGTTGVRLKFNAIDVDGSADDSVQKIAVQWRAGTTGDFINVPAGFIADASNPGAGKTTAIDVTLPAAAAGLPQVQIRIVTADAVNSDEWIGIDDIEVLQGVVNPNQAPVNKVPGTQFIDLDTSVTFSSLTLNGLSVDDVDAGVGELKVNLKVANGTFTLGSVAGLTFTTGDGTADAEMTFTGMLADINVALENSTYTPTVGFNGSDTFTITTDDQGNTGGAAQTDADSFLISINPIIEGAYHNLFTGPLQQDWTNIGLIATSDDWSGVPSIIGFRGDNLTLITGADPQMITAYGKPPVIDVLANETNPGGQDGGGVAEFDTLTNPSVAFQGSATATAPHLNFYLNTTNTTAVTIQYDLIDVDGSTDNALQQVAAQYRVGTSGPFINIPAAYINDATEGPSLTGKTTAVSFVLPVEAEGQAKVQVRVITTNASGADEWVAIDNINISATPGVGGPAKVSDVQVNDDSAQRSQVTSLKVAFNSILSFVGMPADAFTLNKEGGGNVALSASVDNTGPGSVVTLTFTGGSVNGTSLADGLYELKVLALQIAGAGLDGDGNGTVGDDYTLTGTTGNGLFRLFGDADGNGSVTASDFNAFRLAYGTSGSSIFDFDGDNQVSASDFNAFRTRYGVTLVP